MIVDYELKKVRSRLTDRDLALELDGQARDFLIEKGFNPDFGARPLRRAIEQFVEDMLSEAILSGEFKTGHTIRVTHKEGESKLSFEIVDGESGDRDEETDLASAGAETT